MPRTGPDNRAPSPAESSLSSAIRSKASYTLFATASILAASRYGAADALHAELAASQKAILAAITRAVPDMFQKAYRFVGEMEEIGAHSERASTAAIYGGLAKLYQEIADDLGGPKRDIAVLEDFFKAK